MFTGLVAEVGTLVSSRRIGRVNRLSVECLLAPSLEIGASISVDGVCQTVVLVRDNRFEMDATGETLKRTTFARWTGPRKVNLEKPLRICDLIDGHLVTGHVDGTARISSKRSHHDGIWLDIVPEIRLMTFIASQGSVALDGVSLTVSSTADNHFSVSIIPHTLGNSTLGLKQSGDYLNIEVDILARYVERIVSRDRRAP